MLGLLNMQSTLLNLPDGPCCYAMIILQMCISASTIQVEVPTLNMRSVIYQSR